MSREPELAGQTVVVIGGSKWSYWACIPSKALLRPFQK
jgi:hypothetical protein